MNSQNTKRMHFDSKSWGMCRLESLVYLFSDSRHQCHDQRPVVRMRTRFRNTHMYHSHQISTLVCSSIDRLNLGSTVRPQPGSEAVAEFTPATPHPSHRHTRSSPPQRVDRGLRGEQHVRGLRGLATRPARDAVRDVLLRQREEARHESDGQRDIEFNTVSKQTRKR
jgi:hypothetical protein